jgi:hypothetical protein
MVEVPLCLFAPEAERTALEVEDEVEEEVEAEEEAEEVLMFFPCPEWPCDWLASEAEWAALRVEERREGAMLWSFPTMRKKASARRCLYTGVRCIQRGFKGV